MTGKIYQIELDGDLIGTTKLEKADAPMGVSFGQIEFTKDCNEYQFFKMTFKEKGTLLTDEPDIDFLMTHGELDCIKVYRGDSFEIKGVGIQIFGSNSDGFEVSIEGISYPFYEEEFPHHVKEYEEMFKNKE